MPTSIEDRGRTLMAALPPVGEKYAARQADYLKRNHFVDTVFYQSRTGVSPENAHLHYICEGQFQGVQPNRWFDPYWYCGTNNLDANDARNPARHYMDHGWKFGLDPSVLFSTFGYLEQNPDVVDAGMNPLLHFLQHGRRERRRVIYPTFLPSRQLDDTIPPLLRIPEIKTDDIPAGPRFGHLLLARFVEALNARSIPVDIAFLSRKNPDIEHRFRERTKHQIVQGKATLAIRHLGLDWVTIELWERARPVRTFEIRTQYLQGIFEGIETRNFTCIDCRGFIDAHQIPDQILNYATRESDQIILWVHDFFMLSPSHTLLGRFARFDPENLNTTTDPGHKFRTTDGQLIPRSDWQAAWGRLVDRADRVIFEMSGQTLHSPLKTFQQVWPGIVGKTFKINTAPLIVSKTLTPPPNPRAMIIGILGNLEFERGSDVIMDVAARLDEIGSGKLVFVGQDYHNIEWGEAHMIGNHYYDPAHIPSIAEHHEITCWLNPSIWPRPYCDTTREALATDLPVFGFDLGAQSQPLLEGANGHILESNPKEARKIVAEIRAVLSRQPERGS
ncbi:hypothetical protein [Halocynthiibacter styelae]|uniref:Glycosyltransferase n=1 Tax=Halocynthiibacter styelae TaxID=2761955 RepID=A0A8J7LX09_9RHOB|nr:hypothetical protein [Paenihalocynthiibacter styelae]MBI1495082.1 hypothetical protein [Paenihalocynthiibacter styelae]